MDVRLDVSVLGPLRVLRAGDPVAVPAGMQRTLLALLALSPGTVISRDRLIDQLWGERPPDTASTALHGLVSQLRKALDPGRRPGSPGEVLVTRAPGYVLDLPPECVDVTRFERLVREGRNALAEGDGAGGRRLLEEGLALWRGPALADVRETPDVHAASVRLDELRLDALEQRIEADLALGRHEELVPELEELVRREPLRERPREQLMVALYRSGRQVDALEEYRRAREMLLAELGLEPSAHLRELEQQILRQDPELAPPAATGRPHPDRRRRRFALVGASGVALALVALLVSLRVPAEPAPMTVPPGSVGVLDPVRGRIVDTVPVGAGLAAIAYGYGSVWVASAEDGTVTRIDPASRRIVKVIGVGKPCVQLAIGADAVWVANGSAGTLTRIDPSSGTVAATIDLGGADPIVRDSVQAVAVGAGAVWVAAGPGRLVRVDPSTNTVSARYPLDGTAISVAAGLGSVWVGVVTNEVERLDPRSGGVTARVPVLRWPVDLAIADGVLLVSAGSLWAVDPETAEAVPTPRIETNPIGAADVPGAGAWVVELNTGAAVELAPAGGVGHPEVPVGRDPSAIAFGDGLLWIAVRAPEPVT